MLSFFWCGLGQLYTGQIGTGIALMLGHPLMLFLGFALTFGGCLTSAGNAFGLGLIFLLIALVMCKTAALNAALHHDHLRARQDV